VVHVQRGCGLLYQWGKLSLSVVERANSSQLQVPEDVSILFADDNYGNIMTVLPPDKPHKAGAGIYYHVDCLLFHLGS
jgi:hypothetical protein